MKHHFGLWGVILSVPSAIAALGCGANDSPEALHTSDQLGIGRVSAALAGTWTKVAQAIPGGGPPATCRLLTDGRVLCSGQSTSTCTGGSGALQNVGEVSNTWWTLVPDALGSYANGTWKSQPVAFAGKLFNPSFVMRDGRFFECGGEYRYDPTTARCDQFNQPPSFNECEIFDPQSRKWTVAQSMPENVLDTAGALLGNGKALVLGYNTGNAFLFDGSTWSGPGQSARATIGDNEASSLLLQDGSVLVGEQGFSRYLPDNGQWLDTKPSPGGTGEFASGDEIGAFVLLHDGRVLVLGGSTRNGLYTPPTTLRGTNDSWLAAAETPHTFLHGDSAACVEPTGNVLTVAQFSTGLGDGPPRFEEYNRDPNPANPGSWTDVPLPPSGELGVQANRVRLLALPTGQIFMSGYPNGEVWLYNPSGSANNAARPIVTSVSPLVFGEFTVNGTQLAGITTGGEFGDDASLATNYPLVSVLDSASATTYAFTHDFSDTTPRPGLKGSFRFRVPTSVASGSVTFKITASGLDALGPFAGQTQMLPQPDAGFVWLTSQPT